jgi:hypothetical protein
LAFGRGVAIIETVTAGWWTPRVTTRPQFACAAAVALLVLVLHSVHVHAVIIPHEESVSAQTAGAIVMAAALEARVFIDHPGPIAGCVTLEFSAPRVLALALAVAGFLALLMTTIAVDQITWALGRVEIARPPPATRRQALLGVLLS